MRLAGDPEVAAWLEGLTEKEDIFDWNEGNRTKNLKHGVEAAAVEAILGRAFLFEGRVIEPAHDEPRWLLHGEDAAGRRLALIFTRRGNRLRPISCRPMRVKERRRYEETVNREKESRD